jgi:hypothetical protein
MLVKSGKYDLLGWDAKVSEMQAAGSSETVLLVY